MHWTVKIMNIVVNLLASSSTYLFVSLVLTLLLASHFSLKHMIINMELTRAYLNAKYRRTILDPWNAQGN